MNALNSKVLHGYQNNRRHWKIKPEDLDEWAANRDSKPTMSDIVTEQTELFRDEVQVLSVEVGVLRERLAGRDALIEQLRSDLEHARRPWWRKFLDR